MRTITDHEFIMDQNGELALALDVISFDEADEPVLLVAKSDRKAYLRRMRTDVLEIVDINPDVIDRVCKASNVVIMELLGDKITHTYDTPTAMLEG